MCNNKECAEYFKKQRAYDRCFREFRKKWKSYGKAAGTITLHEVSEEERRAISGIIGKVFYEKDIRFSFAEFERGLQRTRYAPVDMKELLQAYFGEILSTNQERQEETQKKKREFLMRMSNGILKDMGNDSSAFLWIQDVISARKYGYQLLMREYGRDEMQAERLVWNISNALMSLFDGDGVEQAEIPLAVFAAEISGNPHYFDRGTTAGQLLMHALCQQENREFPQSAYQWRETLLCAGIVPDNVSSMVHAYGLRLLTKDGWHPAYDAYCRLKEPCVITMENLRGIISARVSEGRVYVVENEMVFSYLVNQAKTEDFTLLCTSGQPRSVALELVPFILAGGAEIYYSGDIDPDGIRIADRLWRKFGDGIRLWRMSPEDYVKCLSEEEIGTVGISKLANIVHPLLKKTADVMIEKQVAGYQENLREELLLDIKINGRGQLRN